MAVSTGTRRRWWQRRERAEDRALTRDTVPAVFFPTTAAGVPVTERSAMLDASVWACVRWLSSTASTLPLHGYRRLQPSGRERVAVELLDSPAPGVTPSAFVADCVASLALYGETFIGIFQADGQPAFLGLLRPDAVEVVIGSDGEPTYTWSSGSKRYKLSRADVIHARLLSIDGVRGASPIAQCREALGLSRSLAEHASAAAAAGYNPAGIVGLPEMDPADPEADEHMQQMVERWNSRSDRPNRIEFVTGQVTYAAVSTPAKDAEFVAQRQLSTVEVCRIFGLYPWMIGAPSGDSNTYANVEQQTQAAVTFSLAPYLVALEQAITAHDGLLPPGDTYAQFEVAGLLRPDHAGRAAFYTAALDEKHGWMTRAEVRDLEDLPPEEATT